MWLCSFTFTHRAKLNFIHYSGQLGDATDIIPGEFEGRSWFLDDAFISVGGHRIWQGSLDLIRYIEEQDVKLDSSSVVVELGCGHGLPGCLMLRKGAKVYFQDLNEDSLSKATIPTIVVNCGVDAVSRSTLICGDWSQTAEKIAEKKIDYILASDTIYTPETIRAFISVVNQLADENTTVWIASQKYYFGLGGGTQALISMIKEMNLPLTVDILKTVGLESVKRDIIQIKKTPVV